MLLYYRRHTDHRELPRGLYLFRYITVNRSATFQTMMGFGSALTDTSAINYIMMNDTSKAAFLTANWGSVAEGGLGYTGEY